MNHQFFVSPSSFDDIGAVLKDMGKGFEHQTLRWKDLKDIKRLQGCDVLFINCALRFGFGFGRKIGPVVRQFVEQGGTLYASDFAVDAIKHAFPDILDYDQEGEAGDMVCEVVDPGLQELVGKTIDVHFNTIWWRITELAKSVRVYVRGSVYQTASGEPAKLPIVVGFEHGKGHVLCTCFHNEAQVSEQEKKLLRFLVLRPILARAAADSAQTLQSQEIEGVKEIIDTIDLGSVSEPFAFDAAGGEALLFRLGWNGEATLKLTVTDPSGDIRLQRQKDRPPAGCEIANAEAGRWTCVVEAVHAPHNNFPFVLTLAGSESGGMKIAAPPPPPTSRKTASPRAPMGKSPRDKTGQAVRGERSDRRQSKPPPPPPPRKRR